MKKASFVLLIAITLLLTSDAFAQLAKSSWGFGFGGTYPRYISSSVTPTEVNYGGYLSLQRNFSEHVALRLQAGYNNLEGEYGTLIQTVKTGVIYGNFDLLYYLAPCEPVSPYINVGIGGIHYKPDNIPNNPKLEKDLKDGALDYQMNFGIGAEWRVGENWKLKTELGYHTVANSKLDGQFGSNNGGILGGVNDAYMSFDLGLLVYFGKGEASRYCDIYTGISADINYDKIEEIVRKYQTKPADVDYNKIEDMFKKHKTVAAAAADNWVLIGVNFDFGKSSLRQESYPILYHAAQVLLTNPSVKVEIQGHTDNIGSDKFNQTLSLQRAETVKRFLVAKGVDASRMTTVGFGKANPIADNKTAEGRSLNRRIEFKVLNR